MPGRARRVGQTGWSVDPAHPVDGDFVDQMLVVEQVLGVTVELGAAEIGAVHDQDVLFHGSHSTEPNNLPPALLVLVPSEPTRSGSTPMRGAPLRRSSVGSRRGGPNCRCRARTSTTASPSERQRAGRDGGGAPSAAGGASPRTRTAASPRTNTAASPKECSREPERAPASRAGWGRRPKRRRGREPPSKNSRVTICATCRDRGKP